ncbi:MAG: alpha/beta hydrolase [Actinomycetia bacterium]|nr:alpha/beta hydrolase [Actinomycetes bacterium]
MSRTKTIAAVGAGAAVAASGAVVVRTLRQARKERVEVARRSLTGSVQHTPDRELSVRTDDGVTLHVEVDEPSGVRENAPTVLLVHGFTISCRAWVFQRRALTEAGYRVVSYDHRGHGRSGSGANDHATIEQLGRDLRRIVDLIEDSIAPGTSIALIGHSMGAMSMMAFGDLARDLIGTRIVAATFMATSAGGEGQLISLGYGAFIGRLIERFGPGTLGGLGRKERLLRPLRRFGRDLEDYFVQHYSFASPVSQSLVRFTGDLAFETAFATIGSFIATFNDHDRRDSLAAWGAVPTLVISAQEDRLTPLEHGRAIAEGIPGSQHVVIANAGHMLMLEHPGLVNDELLQVLDEAARATA